ncbi:M15 family metallopeptidase [Shimazuella kribbensis]|uniref:M15 family metallopeptidase n=1 Tax=Shimazuella kribbensis TaxID=139808 RepID=UPI000428935D|nr:M15 family metallopeptidase [Shimazuella kribbensis]
MNKKKWIFVLGIIGAIFLTIVIFKNYFSHSRKHHEYNVQHLHPKVQSAMEQLIRKAQRKGISIRITEGFRSFDQQDQLYSQGRKKPGPIVTNAKGGQSYHNYGLAIDFALYDEKTHQLSWDIKKDGNKNGISDWQEVVYEAKKLGFSWGGDWEQFKDYPHLEMTFGQSIDELQEMLN